MQHRHSETSNVGKENCAAAIEKQTVFLIAIFTKENPEEPDLYNYSPEADADDALYFNLDTLPRQAMLAINVLHEASAMAITRHKKRHLSPDTNARQKNPLLAPQLGAAARESSQKKKKSQSPTLRHLKDTKLALQEKAKYYEQQRLHLVSQNSASQEA